MDNRLGNSRHFLRIYFARRKILLCTRAKILIRHRNHTRHTAWFPDKPKSLSSRLSMHRTEAPGNGARLSAPADRPLIVNSHLRWDFVWQRPQQLLSRFAEHAPV